jgi:hypothetical protein
MVYGSLLLLLFVTGWPFANYQILQIGHQTCKGYIAIWTSWYWQDSYGPANWKVVEWKRSQGMDYKSAIYLTICAMPVVPSTFYTYLKDILLYLNLRFKTWIVEVCLSTIFNGSELKYRSNEKAIILVHVVSINCCALLIVYLNVGQVASGHWVFTCLICQN